MGISFRKIKAKTRLINPLKGFIADEIPFEIRFDPLTGQTGRIFNLQYTAPERPDLLNMIQRSKDIFCPFCPEALEKSTPLFPKDVIPEGRIRVGQASLIPNLLPLDKYAGVSILSHDHYVAIEDLTVEKMKDAFFAAHTFIKRIRDFDPGVDGFYLNWNYMPPAGSSLIHPHIQVNCGEILTNQHRIQLESCRKYYAKNGRDFWQDFIEIEKESGERFVGETGSICWVMSYVSQSFLPDVWCVFTEQSSLPGLGSDELMGFLDGLSRILRYFYTENIYSFNVSIFSGKEDKCFRINAKICPRLLPRPIGNSDQTYFQTIHKEPYSVNPPEGVCGKVREIFQK
jgi:galactose-1-phosphate uridylyltransferase